METADAMLQERAVALNAAWLAERRWFRSKARRLAAVALLDAAELDAGAGWLLILRARHADGGEERYLVPAVAGPDGGFREPRDGEGTWRAIVSAVARDADLSGATGRFSFRRTTALSELLPGGAKEANGLEERRLEVEQSNTSVRLGDRLILKVYRLLEPGANPEVEMSDFLTEVGFRWAPALAGSVTWTERGGDPATAAMLQELVTSRGDGWRWMIASLGDPPHGPLEAIAGAAQIGGITAEMHAALASRPDLPGFPAGVADARELASWQDAAGQQLARALEALNGPDRTRLGELEARIRHRFAAIGAATRARLSRIHGDYHLGQLLRTEAGFAVIDFEGEPARPLAERRRPGSPLRDVAGMLRSFDYAARSAERAGRGGLAPEAWLADARSAFLSAYGGVTPGEEALLAAFEAEKACYEIRYEANNRPQWTWLPIEALERLAA